MQEAKDKSLELDKVFINSMRKICLLYTSDAADE